MKRKHLLGNRIFMALVFVFLYAPIFILIIFSFNAGNSSAVWKGFSLHWYAELFQNRLIMQSVYTTLLVSVLSTLIATVAGTFAAIGLASMRRRWRTPLMTVNNIPVMNAEIVTGVSMCLLFVAFFGLWKAYEDEDEEYDDFEEPVRQNAFEDRKLKVEDRRNKVVNIHATTQLKVVLVKPERFENASEIADHLKDKRTVVLNLESTNKDIARRLIDFLSGVAYAGEGKIKKVAANTYIITPYHVDIEGDLIDELENNGLYF